MSTITTRAAKGSALTFVEVDANFTNLNTDKVEENSDVTFTQVNVDNLRLDANRLSSTNTDGDVEVEANGTGSYVFRGNTNSAKITLNCSTNAHGVTLASPPHSSAATYELELPDVDGTDGQTLVTDGAGKLSFADASGGISTGKAIAMAIVFG